MVILSMPPQVYPSNDMTANPLICISLVSIRTLKTHHLLPKQAKESTVTATDLQISSWRRHEISPKQSIIIITMVINHGAVRNSNMYTCSALYVTLKLGLRQRYHVDRILTLKKKYLNGCLWQPTEAVFCVDFLVGKHTAH